MIEAYKAFDLRRPGWIKVELEPGSGMNYGLSDGRTMAGVMPSSTRHIETPPVSQAENAQTVTSATGGQAGIL